MTKQEFLKKLDKSSKTLSPEDREDLLQYYEEYTEDLEDLNSLTPPKEIVKQIKRELKHKEGFDLGTHTLSLNEKQRINYGQIASAKKQLLFIAVVTLVLTAIHDLAQAVHPLLFFDIETGALLLPGILLPLLLISCSTVLHSILLEKGVFQPLEYGFQRYYLLKYLFPQFALWLFLKANMLPYRFLAPSLDALPCYTVMQRFVAMQAYNYAELLTPCVIYFFLATFTLVPINFIIYKDNNHGKKTIAWNGVVGLLCIIGISTQIATSPSKEEGQVRYIAQYAPLSMTEREAFMKENFVHLTSYDQLKLTFDQIEEVTLYDGIYSIHHISISLLSEESHKTDENLEKYRQLVLDITQVDEVEVLWATQSSQSGSSQLFEGYFGE